MCEPLTVLAVAGGAYNYLEASEAAKEQAEFEAERAATAEDAARRDAIAKFSALGRRTAEERDRTQREILQITRSGRAALGTASAGAASGGVEGGSVDALLSDFARQEIARVEAAEASLSATEDQIDRNRDAVEAQSATRLFQTQARPVQTPNLFGALIDIGTTIAGNYLVGGQFAGPTVPGDDITDFPELYGPPPAP